MTLDQYLSVAGAPTVTEFRKRMADLGYVVKSNAQIRQWRYGYKDRLPDAENCMGIHLASNGRVTLKELRPADWWRIWPDADGAVAARIAASDDTQNPTGGYTDSNKLAMVVV